MWSAAAGKCWYFAVLVCFDCAWHCVNDSTPGYRDSCLHPTAMQFALVVTKKWAISEKLITLPYGWCLVYLNRLLGTKLIKMKKEMGYASWIGRDLRDWILKSAKNAVPHQDAKRQISTDFDTACKKWPFLHKSITGVSLLTTDPKALSFYTPLQVIPRVFRPISHRLC